MEAPAYAPVHALSGCLQAHLCICSESGNSTARSVLVSCHCLLQHTPFSHTDCLVLGFGALRPCRQLLRLLQQHSEQAQDAHWSLPLADLQQWVLSSAARLLKPELAAAGHAAETPPDGEPEGGQDRAPGAGVLRAHPLVSATCQLLELLVLLEATDAGSPAVSAGEPARCSSVHSSASGRQCCPNSHTDMRCVFFQMCKCGSICQHCVHDILSRTPT